MSLDNIFEWRSPMLLSGEYPGTVRVYLKAKYIDDCIQQGIKWQMIGYTSNNSSYVVEMCKDDVDMIDLYYSPGDGTPYAGLSLGEFIQKMRHAAK